MGYEASATIFYGIPVDFYELDDKTVHQLKADYENLFKEKEVMLIKCGSDKEKMYALGIRESITKHNYECFDRLKPVNLDTYLKQKSWQELLNKIAKNHNFTLDQSKFDWYIGCYLYM